MKKIVYALFYLFSLLPFWVMRLFADIAFVLIYYVIRYRRRLVRQNITSSFPQKSAEEIRRIERRFYLWFCDNWLEAVKLLSLSDEGIKRHLEIQNMDLVQGYLDSGRDVAALLGHHNNWEYLTALGVALPRKHIVGLVYHPLHSESIDYLFQRIRSSQCNGLVVPKNQTLRVLQRLHSEGKYSLFGYVADQTPKWENIHLWLPFLNHDTPVFTGGERIARKYNQPVVFIEMKRKKRNYYSCYFHLITDEPASLPEGEITRRFFVMLEKAINESPETYLWTHNRWKRTHEEFDRRFEVVHGKVVERKPDATVTATDAAKTN